MRVRKSIAFFIAVLVLTAVFGGCTNGFGSQDSENVLRVGVYNTSKEVAAIQTVIDAFKAQNAEYLTEKGIDEIEIKQISESSYSTKIQSMARTGTLPDVYMSIDTLAPGFASQNVSLNLTPYITADSDYQALVDDMYASMYEQGLFGGEYHMVAREYSRVVVYYNKTLLTGAGLAVPENSWTWDDFVSKATALVKRDNDIVVQNGADLQLNWPATLLPVVYGLGGKIFNGSGDAAVDSTTSAAYARLKTLVDSGAVANTFLGSGTSFSNKSIAMICGTRASISEMLEYFGKDSDEWGVVPFPDTTAYNQDSAYIGTGTSGYSVSAKSTKKDIAVKFALFLLSEEGQKAICSTGNYIPVRKAFAESEFWSKELDIGLPANFNHDAYVYRTDYDLTPFSTMVKDASKQALMINQVNSMTEYFLKYGTSVPSLGYSDVNGWANYWNGELNSAYA